MRTENVPAGRILAVRPLLRMQRDVSPGASTRRHRFFGELSRRVRRPCREARECALMAASSSCTSTLLPETAPLGGRSASIDCDRVRSGLEQFRQGAHGARRGGDRSASPWRSGQGDPAHGNAHTPGGHRHGYTRTVPGDDTTPWQEGLRPGRCAIRRTRFWWCRTSRGGQASDHRRRGRLTRNAVCSPSTLWTPIRPPISSTASLQNGRPSPVSLAGALAGERRTLRNFSNTLARSWSLEAATAI